MRIQNNNLLVGDNKRIQVYNNSFISKDGPNLGNKLSLSDLDIKYDSIFTANQTIVSGAKDQPIMYGFLGTDISFLLVKPFYGLVNSQCCSGSNYMEYYFEDQPLIRRTFTDLLVLTGDAEHRIPQVYLYNPSDNTVSIEIMAANLDENIISTSLVPTYTELKGLSYSSIRTDEIYGVDCTGSTQFEIFDISGNLQMVIPYNKIDIITIENELLTVSTKSDDDVKLTFLSNFNAMQALSRMNWVQESSINRYATSISPGLDTTAPVILFKPHSVPEVMPYINGVVTQANLRFRFIDSVIDYDNSNIVRDGEINNEDVDLLIINNATGEQLTNIINDANYSVTFTVKDLAGNSTSSTKSVTVDGLPPTIYYTSGFTTNLMDLTGDTQTTGIIEEEDLRSYYLDYVWDAVDGIIPNSAVTISIQSGTTIYTSITGIGYYEIGFSVQDTARNITTGCTILRVTESEEPVIVYNSVFVNTEFTMSISGDTLSTTEITADDIRTYAISGVTDNYDTIAVSSVTVSGTTFPIDETGTFEIIFSVIDSAGNETIATRGLITTN